MTWIWQTAQIFAPLVIGPLVFVGFGKLMAMAGERRQTLPDHPDTEAETTGSPYWRSPNGN